MKRSYKACLSWAAALSMLLCPPALAAQTEQTVSVQLPTFPVTLNGTTINNAMEQYPLLVYNDITYFPMTYHGSRFLHLKANWYQPESIMKGVLFVGYCATPSTEWTGYPTDIENPATDTATIADCQVALNTVDRTQLLDNSAQEYPLLSYRDVTYFPLTWQFAVREFGWTYHFDTETGLSITASPAFQPELEDASQLASLTPSTALRQKSYLYNADHTEYVGYPYTNLGGATFVYQRQGEDAISFDALSQFNDGEYYFNRQLDANGNSVPATEPPTLHDGVLTIPAVRINQDGTQSLVLTIDLRT